MLTEEVEYHRARAETELMQAAAAGCSQASEAHRELARLYSIRADELDAEVTDGRAGHAHRILLSVFRAPNALSA